MYLLDTDTVIYALKGVPEIRSHLQSKRSAPMAISVITLMELYFGAHKSERVAGNLAKIRAIETAFEVLSLGKECAEVFGVLKADLQARGLVLDDFDLALAATALTHNLVLVSNNSRHFNRIGELRLENWSV